jgi:hypothetical protein
MATTIQRYKLHLMTLSRADLEAEVHKREAELAQHSPDRERLFFNERFANTDYDHWASKGAWSLEEAASLLLGKDPDVVNADTFVASSRLLNSQPSL